MAFHLKNLKTQKDKFFLHLTADQLCNMVQDGEIMNYINTVPHRRDEIANIFASIGDTCNPRKFMQSSVRQKKLAPLVVQLSKIIKEYEAKKIQLSANLAEMQRKQKEAANAAAAAQAKAAENRQREANAANAQLKLAQAATATAVANVLPQITSYENSALTKELTNLQTNFKKFQERLNQAIQNSRSATRKNTAAAVMTGGKRKKTRKNT